MLDQLGFEGGVPSASDRTEPVYHVMELNRRHEKAIQYSSNCIPQYLDQTDAMEVDIKLWDQDDGLPGALFRKVWCAYCVYAQTLISPLHKKR